MKVLQQPRLSVFKYCDRNCAMMLTSHGITLASRLMDRVTVMYVGEAVDGAMEYAGGCEIARKLFLRFLA